MRVANAALTVASGATGDLSASFNSDPFDVYAMTTIAIAATVSGSATLNGTIKLQASCDHGQRSGQAPPTGVTNWVDIAGTTSTITADGSTMWNLSGVGFKWLRAVYTRTAGTGTVAIRAHAKGED